MTDALAVPIVEAARLIGCSRTKLYELIKNNEIALVKIGRKSVVPVAALRSFIDTRATKSSR